jgi:shikimate dehydrogenase
VAEPRIGGATRVAAVLGWPVTHSLSPVIHNAGFAALGMDWTYVALPVEPGEVPAAVAGLRALGFAGANVTMPHKEAVADVMDDLTEDADRLRAVNTIEVVRDRLIGHNTDAPGFARFLAHDVGFEPAGKTALLFGAGGAARACALAVARAGLTRIVVALREPARAAPVADALDGFATEVEAIAFDDAAEASADLVVNATPLGAHGEGLPLPKLGPDGPPARKRSADSGCFCTKRPCLSSCGPAVRPRSRSCRRPPWRPSPNRPSSPARSSRFLKGLRASDDA